MSRDWNPWFFIPLFLALAAGGLLLLNVRRGEEVLFINGLHTPFLDCVFYYGTTLGNGLLYFILGILLAWRSLRFSVIAVACFSVTGILISFLKKVIFSEVMRPSVVLAGEPLHFVEGVKILTHHSFPSGHTATAFSMFCLLSLMAAEKKWGLLFIVMALLSGVSRIYLTQHFFVDVYFGAALGTMVTSLVWSLFSKKQWLEQWQDKSLASYMRKL